MGLFNGEWVCHQVTIQTSVRRHTVSVEICTVLYKAKELPKIYKQIAIVNRNCYFFPISTRNFDSLSNASQVQFVVHTFSELESNL